MEGAGIADVVLPLNDCLQAQGDVPCLQVLGGHLAQLIGVAPQGPPVVGDLLKVLL